ncbi:MAG: hypothetical protein PHD71_02805 [Methanospirillum sp.]|nr:hypothetical protein [Methanospirillum sp.]
MVKNCIRFRHSILNQQYGPDINEKPAIRRVASFSIRRSEAMVHSHLPLYSIFENLHSISQGKNQE